MLSVNIMHRAWVREAFEQLVTAVVNERVNNVPLASRVTALHCDVKPVFKYTNAELAAQIEQCQMIGQWFKMLLPGERQRAEGDDEFED